LAADRLAFDDSPEGERLRRFDLACGRGLARSLDSLLKLRRAPELFNAPSSMVPGPLSAAADALESSATPNETNEPTDARENVSNEPTDACQIDRNGLNGIRSRIKIKSRIKSEDRRPTLNDKNVSDEPTLAASVGLESPTFMEATEQNSTNEPTDVCENVSKEPADAHDIGPDGASLSATARRVRDCRLPGCARCLPNNQSPSAPDLQTSGLHRDSAQTNPSFCQLISVENPCCLR
jgi:hypothetical protein